MRKAATIGVLIATLSGGAARASYVRDYAVTAYQPDGSKVRIYLSGDEFCNWARDEHGYTLLRRTDTGYIVCARKAAGRLVPTGVVAGRDEPWKAGLVPGVAPEIGGTGMLRWRSRETALQPYRASLSHNTGTFNNIVVFVRFADEAPSVFTHTLAEYDTMLNGLSGTNSQRNYFREVSYNALTINSAFFPAQGSGAIVSYQDAHPRAYYKPYDAATNPVGYTDDEWQRESELLVGAVNGVRAEVEASGLDVDVDRDGTVDNIVFVVGGDVTAWSTLLWPHMNWLSDATIGGASVGPYNLQLERYLFSGHGVGVLCHEMFHSLGAPDLYHYTDNGISPVGAWDLMDQEQNPPQHMLAYMKWKYGGWLNGLNEAASPGRYTLSPVTAADGGCLKVRSTNSLTQFFVAEYRRKTGVFESSVPGSGLIVYRIDPSVTGNASGPPDEVYIYRPGGTRTVNGDVSSAYYSAGAGRTAINNSTSPPPFLQSGAAGYLDIRNIGYPGTTISFDVNAAYPPATRLGFAVQPGPVRPGAALSPAPQVAAYTDLGYLNPNTTGTVTVALRPGSGSPGASLGGVLSAALKSGVATFEGLSVDLAGSAYVLTACSGSLACGDSAAFSVTPSGTATMRANLSSRQAEAAHPYADAPCLSPDGRYAAFSSEAANLVAGDMNNTADVFVKDLVTEALTRVSVSTSGGEANGASGAACLSATGRYVLFESSSDNLVPADANDASDVFLRDTVSNTTTRVSVNAAGEEGNGPSHAGSVSADGRYVAFTSDATNLVAGDTNGVSDVFVRDTVAQTTMRVSVGPEGGQANGPSYGHLSISDDGAYVAFQSDASNLVPEDTNGVADVFVASRASGIVERVSVASDGTEGAGSSVDASMSSDGRYVAFTSRASLAAGASGAVRDVFLRDRLAGTTELVSVSTSGAEANDGCSNPDVSADGRYVCFTSPAGNLVGNDTNGVADVFVRDRSLSRTDRVSLSGSGAQANGASQCMAAGHTISAGPVVAFLSVATNLDPTDLNGAPDAFARNVATAATLRVSAGPNGIETGGGGTFHAVTGGTGRYVAFESTASNLVPGDTNDVRDVFVRDRQTGATERVSVGDSGAEASSDCSEPAMTPDGRYVTFTSRATGLVTGAGGNLLRIYRRDRVLGRTAWVSSAAGLAPDGDCSRSSISADGSCITFLSRATNLVAGDTNGVPDWFWRNTTTGATLRASVSSGGEQANGSSDAGLCAPMSADGRYVAYTSAGSNLVPDDANNATDVFVFDTVTLQTECVSVDGFGKPGNGASLWPSISGDGRYVAFMSAASNLTPDDTNGLMDVFVRDRVRGQTMRASAGLSRPPASSASRAPAISADGRFIAFVASDGSQLDGDRNGQSDVFVTDTLTGATVRVSVSDFDLGANGESLPPVSLSADGRWVAYAGYASNLVPGDLNTASDVFVRGPLWSPFALTDVVDALRYSGGLLVLSEADSIRLNVTRQDGASVDVADAIAIARKVAGLDPTP